LVTVFAVFELQPQSPTALKLESDNAKENLTPVRIQADKKQETRVKLDHICDFSLKHYATFRLRLLIKLEAF
jgi:hypothetical protein